MEAKIKYKSISEWRKADPRAFNKAYKEGWLDVIADRYGWERYVKPIRISIDDIINSGIGYDTYVKWRKNEPDYYRKARKRGVINKICDHFNWTFENVGSSNEWTIDLYLESIYNSKSKSFSEWRVLAPTAFRSAYSKKKLDEISDKLNWEGYNYKLRLNNKKRRRAKKNGYWVNKQRCLDSALKFDSRIKWSNGEPGAQGAARKYGWYEECTAHMPNLLTVKCGHWNSKSRCLEDALLYTTRGDWRKNSGSAYLSAKRNGWYEECTAHMAKIKYIKYTKEECLTEALLHTTKGDWRKSNLSMYNFTNKQIWREECFQHMVKRLSKYNLPKEDCIELSKKCKNLSHFAKNYSFAYKSAKANGFLDECKEFMHNRKDWTYEECLTERKKWSGRVEWKKESSHSYYYAKKMDWVDNITIEIKGMKPIGWWNNKQRCLDSSLEFNRITDWTNGFPTAVAASRRNGWFEECTEHMTKSKERIKTIDYTKEECLKNALLHATRGDWCKGGTIYYNCAKRNNWYEECTAHMTRKHKTTIKDKFNYTKEECLKNALLRATRGDWRKNDIRYYNCAKRNNWYEECTAHMTRKHNATRIPLYTKEECIQSALLCGTKSDWNDKSPKLVAFSKRNGWYRECTTHMARRITKKTQPKNGEIINLRISEDLKLKMKELAEKEDINISKLIRNIFEKI